MKSLRLLVLAVGTFPGLMMQAHAQQEVDPDHFDQPSVLTNAHASKAPNHNSGIASHNQHQGNPRLASKHAAGKGSHHHAHVAV